MFNCTAVERVIRELDLVVEGSAFNKDPVLEQLRACPEAFKAGEMLGKALYAETQLMERLLLPAELSLFA